MKANEIGRDFNRVTAVMALVIVGGIVITIRAWPWIVDNQNAALFLATLSLAITTAFLFWATFKLATDAIAMQRLEYQRIDTGVVDQLCNLLKSVELRMLLAKEYAAHPLRGDDWMFSRLLERVFSADAAVALRAAAPEVSTKVYAAVRVTQTSIASIEHMRTKYYEEVEVFRKTLKGAEVGDAHVIPKVLTMPTPADDKIKSAAAAASKALRDARSALGDTSIVNEKFKEAPC